MKNLHIISFLFIMLSTLSISMENKNNNCKEANHIGKLAKNPISQYEINTPNKKSSRDLKSKLVLPNFLTKEIIKYLFINDLKKIVEIGDISFIITTNFCVR